MTSSQRLPDFLPAGKLPLGFLQTLLQKYANVAAMPNRLKVGAGLGRDAAVIDFGDRRLIAKTDPITFVAEDIGDYALHINANDVACMGGEPKWFLNTLLLPEKTAPAQVEKIFQQLGAACESLGVALCGGHTEITTGLDRPIIAGCLLGEAPNNRFFSPERIEPGDAILLTKGLAVEATSLIGRLHAQKLTGTFDDEFAQNCRRYLRDPGLSVLPEARLAWQVEGGACASRSHGRRLRHRDSRVTHRTRSRRRNYYGEHSAFSRDETALRAFRARYFRRDRFRRFADCGAGRGVQQTIAAIAPRQNHGGDDGPRFANRRGALAPRRETAPGTAQFSAG